jgi:hypothetical protein
MTSFLEFFQSYEDAVAFKSQATTLVRPARALANDRATSKSLVSEPSSPTKQRRSTAMAATGRQMREALNETCKIFRAAMAATTSLN